MKAADLRALALTNYGHFTSMRVENGHVRGLALHLERLTHDCRALFGTDLDLEGVRELCKRETAGLDAAVVRVTVFDPELDLTHPGEAMKPQGLVTVRPAASLPAAPLRVQSITYARELPEAKHVGLFGTVYWRRQAQLAGFDDVLFLDAEGKVCEGATWNIGFVNEGQVLWPLGKSLPGVTMRLLQEAHPSTSAHVSMAHLAGMEAAFATNANVGVRVISAIDDLRFPVQHPVLAELADSYRRIPMDRL